MATTKMAVAPRRDLTTETEKSRTNENIPRLLTRLGDDVMQFFDTKVALLKVEIKEEINTFVRGSAVIAAGAVLAAIGFALVNVAVAFGISALLADTSLTQAGKYALGFVITGVIYLVIGGIMAMAMKARLSNQAVIPKATVAELRKDTEWVKNEL